MADSSDRPDPPDLLYQASLEFNATLDPDELLPRVFDRALDILEAEAGSIWIRRGDQLVCQIGRGPVGVQIEGLELPVGAGIVGAVAASGEAELIEDPREDSRFVHQVDEATGFTTRSMIAAPLRAKDQVLGVLQVINKETGTGRFGQEDLALLDGLGATAGLALRNARLHDVERRAKDLERLLEISREIASSLDVDRLALTVVNLASKVLSYDRAALSLVEAGQLEVRAVSGQESVDTRQEEMQRLDRLIEWLAERGQVLYVRDLEIDGQRGETGAGAPADVVGDLRRAFTDYLEGRSVRSLCLIPLEDEEGRLGALYLESTSPEFLGEQGLEAARLLATQTAVALRNAELYEEVPFIGLLEPVARLRRKLETMPRGQLLRQVGVPAAVILALLAIPWSERIDVGEAVLRPGNRMPVRATVGGLVTAVPVAEGEQVEKGEVLARLRDDQVRMRLQEVRGDLATAERRASRARAEGDVSAARMAEIAVERYGATLDLLGEQLERTRLRAPVSGTVLTPRPEERLGERLEAGETFVVLGQRRRLELEGGVRQGEVERVERGQAVRLKVAALPSHTFVGEVSQIAPRAHRPGNPGTPVVRVRAMVEDTARLLRPGMEAEAKIVGPRRPIGFHLLRPLVDWIRLNFWW